jgi:hypothetical protein
MTGSKIKSILFIQPDQVSKVVKSEIGATIFSIHTNPLQPFASPVFRQSLHLPL